MSPDVEPDDQAVRDLLPVLRRIAFALEQAVRIELIANRPNAHIQPHFGCCNECGCTLVTGSPASRVQCPACWRQTEVT